MEGEGRVRILQGTAPTNLNPSPKSSLLGKGRGAQRRNENGLLAIAMPFVAN